MERIIEPASAAKQHSWHPGLAFTLILSYFILFGLTFGSQGVIWANLVTELNLSKGVFGTAQLSGPLLSIVILLQAGPLCTRFGKKRVAMAGLAALTCAIAILALANNLPLLVLALTLSGAGFGLIEVAANSATLDWEHATGGKVMNFMHAGFSGGAVIGALVAGALLGLGFNYHQILMLVAIAAGLMFLATIPIRYPPVEMAAAVSGGPGEALRLLFGSRLIIALAIICMISTIGESVANTWAVIYLIQLGASSVIGGAAFALFNGTMFVGRLTNAALVARLGERISLIGSGVCMLLAGIILITSTSVLPAIIAFALLGIAVAGAIPTVLSATARIAPGQSGAVTGAIMSVAYLSFIICPPLIGWAAELVTLRWTLLIVAITGAIQIALGRTTPRTNS